MVSMISLVMRGVKMKDIGDYLKEVRQARGFTYSDVELATRIPAKYLEAMEEGAFDKMPGQAYVIGFLRSYAKFLQVDSDELVNYYKETAGIVDETVLPLPGQIDSGDKEALAKANYQPMKKWQTGILLSFLAIVIAGGVLYYLGVMKNDPRRLIIRPLIRLITRIKRMPMAIPAQIP